MEELRALTEALNGSLDDLEPPPFYDRVTTVVGDTPSSPGVLTVKTARAIDADADIQVAATRGAGVQLCYEGLELTRSILRNQPWEDGDSREDYYQDLVVAEVLVSRGFYNLAETGVVTDAVDIVKRFGRTQTTIDQLGGRHAENPLEVDVLALAVNAGVDQVMDGVLPSIRARSDAIARELLDYPLPAPEELAAVDDQLAALATEARVARANQ